MIFHKRYAMTKEYTDVSVSGNKITGKNIKTGHYETIVESDEP